MKRSYILASRNLHSLLNNNIILHLLKKQNFQNKEKKKERKQGIKVGPRTGVRTSDKTSTPPG